MLSLLLVAVLGAPCDADCSLITTTVTVTATVTAPKADRPRPIRTVAAAPVKGEAWFAKKRPVRRAARSVAKLPRRAARAVARRR